MNQLREKNVANKTRHNVKRIDDLNKFSSHDDVVFKLVLNTIEVVKFKSFNDGRHNMFD